MPSNSSQSWGTSPAGNVTRHTLTNDRGNSVSILDYGAIVQSIKIDGQEMVVGFDAIEGYLGDQPYYGALIGRFANRIAEAQFPLHGKTYDLAANEGENQLHGGPRGFDKYVWAASLSSSNDSSSLKLSHVSPDGDMGYPGNLSVTCTYTWNNNNELRIEYTATSDQDTVVNLTNHSYFRLGEELTVTNYRLEILADHYLEKEDGGIPTGVILPVAGTALDFRREQPLRPGLEKIGGYDHYFVVNNHDKTLREFALVTDPDSGRKLRCYTTEPGVQFFTAGFEEGEFFQRGGTPFPTYGAICLETQHPPDAPNHENFPSTVLKVGEIYNSSTVYRFE